MHQKEGLDLKKFEIMHAESLIKTKEHNKLTETIQDLDFTTATSFPLIFKFMREDQDQFVRLMQTNADEYNEVRMDPNNTIKMEKIKLKNKKNA